MQVQSISDPLGACSKRCSYCGRFRLPEEINASTNFCDICAIKMAGNMSKEAAETADLMQASHYESPLSSAPEGNQLEEPTAMDVDGPEGASEVHGESSGIREGEGSNSDKGEQQEDGNDDDDRTEQGEGTTAQACGRCWEKPATRTLYSCPTCEDCVAMANTERVSIYLPSATTLLPFFHLNIATSQHQKTFQLQG